MELDFQIQDPERWRLWCNLLGYLRSHCGVRFPLFASGRMIARYATLSIVPLLQPTDLLQGHQPCRRLSVVFVNGCPVVYPFEAALGTLCSLHQETLPSQHSKTWNQGDLSNTIMILVLRFNSHSSETSYHQVSPLSPPNLHQRCRHPGRLISTAVCWI